MTANRFWPLSRRAVLAQISAAGLLGACQSVPGETSRNAGRSARAGLAGDAAAPFVDVHCHVFNATDLPVRGFIQRVVFEDYEEQAEPVSGPQGRGVFPSLTALIVDFIVGSGVNADDELEQLRSTRRRGRSAETFDPASDAAVADLAQSLERVLSRTPPDPRARNAMEDVPPESVEALEAAIDAELGTSLSDARGRIGGINDRQELARNLFGSDGFVGRHLRWAGWLRAPRLELVRELHELYGSDGVGLYTPALIDYSAWLDTAPRSPLADQLAVMEEVQIQAPAKTGAQVHCMMAFDPWRQVLDEDRNAPVSALDLVQEAVENRGFLGVKLYPPMGFLPAGNAGSGLTYPDGSDEIPGFGARLDAAMDNLFRWAADRDVAIMAHSTNSQGAGPGYALRSHPKHWRPVLQRYPNLRVNLAHFGRFEEAPEVSDWEETAGGLILSYPNAYLDLSYLSEVVPALSSDATLIRVREGLRRFIATYDPDVQHLLYGSDWVMLGREKEHQSYISALKELFDDLGLSDAAWARFMGGNAFRFYGLTEGGAARRRLQVWAAARGVDLPAWLLPLTA